MRASHASAFSGHFGRPERVAFNPPARGSACAQTLGRIALSVVAIAVHFWLVRSSSFSVALLPLFAFAILTIARTKSTRPIQPLPPLSRRALIVFASLHALLIAVGIHFGPTLALQSHSHSLHAAFVTAGKLLVLLPTLVLFPLDCNFLKQVWQETVAACIVLFTFSPDRLFAFIWPTYSRWLGAWVATVCRLFVPGAYTTNGSEGVVVVGPSVDLHVNFACSGIVGITLFQILFGFIVAVEWNRINKSRALVGYILGSATYLFANSLRLIVVFLTSNLASRPINVNWPLFILIFYSVIRITQKWMLPTPQAEDGSHHGQPVSNRPAVADATGA